MKGFKKFQIVLLLFFIGISILSGCNSLTDDESTDGDKQEKTNIEAVTESDTEAQTLEEAQIPEETEWFSSSEEITGLGLPEDMLAYFR